MEIRRLNTLRGIAAYTVVISHYSNHTNAFHGVLGYGSGRLGVMLFFLLSGFLMAYLYGSKSGTVMAVKRFIVARFARVFPLFSILVLLSYALHQIGIDIVFDIYNIKDIITNLLCLEGNHVFWTIPPEIQFYLVFALIWVALWRNSKVYYAAMFILAFACIWLGQPIYDGEIIGLDYRVKILQLLPIFITGLLMGHLYTKWKPKHTINSALLLVFVIVMVFTQILFTMFQYSVWNHPAYNNPPLIIGMALLFFCTVFLTTDNNRWLSNKFGDFVGRISYSVYLIHLPILYWLLNYIKIAPELIFLPFLVIITAASYITYKYIEYPSRHRLRVIGGIN